MILQKPGTFDKVKKETEPKNTWGREVQGATHQRWPCRYCGGSPHTKTMPSLWKNMCSMQARWGTSGRCAGAKENHVVHEAEIDMEPESQEEDIEIVSINSLYINRKWSSITAKLEIQVGQNSVRNLI